MSIRCALNFHDPERWVIHFDVWPQEAGAVIEVCQRCGETVYRWSDRIRDAANSL